MSDRTAIETPEQDPLLGTRFRTLRLIARGSTADVLEAEGPGRAIFAVKVLRAEHLRRRGLGSFGSSAEIDWRFAQEARVSMTTRHPNLVPVHSVGTTAAGRPYLVMPALRGETLRRRLDRAGTLPPARVCALLAGALEGLEAVHRRGVVHRDVKPANLFLTAPDPTSTDTDERAVVLDFGVAQVGGVTFDPCTGAHILGTPRYLAPEQVLGGAVDARTDVYAMALVVFEAIAGRGPYATVGPFEVMRAHVEREPERLRSLVYVPAALDEVLARALRKAPAERWPSATTFAAALREAADHRLARRRGPRDDSSTIGARKLASARGAEVSLRAPMRGAGG
jgi:serine/threonine-protein kinase